MEQNYLTNEEQQADQKLPATLNVLTILTFIGCGLGAIAISLTKQINEFMIGNMNKMIEGKDLSEKKLAELNRAKDIMENVNEHLVAYIAIGLIGMGLCFLGALWMRNRKKDGFWLYVAGEIGPLIAIPIVLDSYEQLKGIGGVFAVAIPVAMIVLYAFQRKHLNR